MKRWTMLATVACLAFAAAGVEAGESGNCSPEGTWYGYNTIGDIWIVTVTRSGPSSFTTVMDFGPNNVFLTPVIVGYSDFRGELLKTGPQEYDWTTMALWRGDGSAGSPPFAMGYCPLEAVFTGCDSWEGSGTCDFYGFLEFDDDPFTDGFWIGSGAPLEALFKRMPMKYPTP